MLEEDATARLAWHVKLLQSVEEHTKRCQELEIVKDGSCLDLDDQALGSLQTSHLVAYSLGAAEDALRTARVVLDFQENLRIPLIGLYPLLRTALESSALTIWLLRPEDRAERLRRSLGSRWSDILHDDRAVVVSLVPSPGEPKAAVARRNKLLRENSKTIRARKGRIRSLAEALGIEVDERNGIPGFGPLIADIASPGGPTAGELRGTWHHISGLTHPSASRFLGLSDVEELSFARPGTYRARMTAKTDVVVWAMDTALWAYIAATALVAQRGGESNYSWSRQLEPEHMPPRAPQACPWLVSDGLDRHRPDGRFVPHEATNDERNK